jgi:hypothetical protein
MSDADVTLNVLFGLRSDVPLAAHLSTIERSNCFKMLEKRMLRMPSGFLEAAASEVLGRLRKILDVPISGVVASAWNKGREFKKYTDRKEFPPDARHLVALATHTVTFAQEPRVDVLVNEVRVGTVTFKAQLSVTFEAAKVAVQDARFVALHTGTCSFEGTIECEGATLTKRTSKDYTLPGVLSFGKGIPIVPSLGARSSPPAVSDALVPASAPPSSA